MNPTSFRTSITPVLLGLLLAVFIIAIPSAPQAGASERTGKIISEIVRRWKVEKKDMPRGRILITVSDMKGWKGFHSISFVFEFKKDFDSIEWVNSNKQQTYEHAEGNKDMSGVRPGSKAAYADGLEKHHLFFGVVIRY